MRKYIVLGVILLFMSTAWLGLSKFADMVRASVEKQMTEVIQKTIQRSVDTQFAQFREEYKNDIRKIEEERQLDKMLADKGSSSLDSVGNGWVYVDVPIEPPTPSAEVGKDSEQRLTRKIRAELSAEFSGAIKAEAKRADSCAIDYNTLMTRYNALDRQVKDYNEWVDQYNESIGYTK